MEAVAPFTIQWRQMNGPYYHERMTYWSSDWNVNGKGKRATPGIQVEFASGCFYQAKLHRIR